MTGLQEPQHCPKCQKEATWNHGKRQWECKACGITGFNEKSKAGQTKPAQTTIPSDDKNYVTDIFTERLIDGTTRTRSVTWRAPMQEHPPERMIDMRQIAFQRFRLKQVAALERRWGRDYLRKQREKPVREDMYLIDAIWTAMKAFRKPLADRPSTSAEDLEAYVEEINKFLDDIKK